MQLSVKPHPKNEYPIRGVLIKGPSVLAWLGEMQLLGLSPANTVCYPLPGPTANSLWGCLVIPPDDGIPSAIGRNSYCQQVHPQLFLAEYSQLSPLLGPAELDKLVKDTVHFFHPSVGWVELSAPVDWAALVDWQPFEKDVTIPADSVHLPSAVRSFQLVGLAPQEVLEKLDAQLFPEKHDTTKGPLSGWERFGLGVLRFIFSGPVPFLPIPRGSGKEKGTRPKWVSKLEKKLDELEQRNMMEADKLLELFKKNPEEALKYAIPIGDGTTRGRDGDGAFRLAERWSRLSVSGRGVGGGGGTVSLGDRIRLLEERYTQTAEMLVKRGEYSKAAFVYLRLLKNYVLAAGTLEKGGLYSEAASVYLEYCKDKHRAAECYERAGMAQQAIDLYKELGENEKIGDVYLSIDRREEAGKFYEKVVSEYRERRQFLKASLLVRNKIADGGRAQAMLIEGWREGSDPVNCLNTYFAYFPDKDALADEIRRVYEAEVPENCRHSFLQVMKTSYSIGVAAETPRDIAYEIIAARALEDPSIVAELNAFNKGDRHIISDILKYKHARRGR